MDVHRAYRPVLANRQARASSLGRPLPSSPADRGLPLSARATLHWLRPFLIVAKAAPDVSPMNPRSVRRSRSPAAPPAGHLLPAPVTRWHTGPAFEGSGEGGSGRVLAFNLVSGRSSKDWGVLAPLSASPQCGAGFFIGIGVSCCFAISSVRCPASRPNG